MYYRYSYNDAVEQESALPRWHQEYRQISTGSYDGQVLALRMPGVEIYREQINVATEQVYSAPEGSMVFYYYPKNDMTQLIQGEEMLSKAGFAFDWVDRVGIMDTNSDLLMVVVDQPDIARNPSAFSGFVCGPMSEQADFLAEWLNSLIHIAKITSCDHQQMSMKNVLPGLIQDRLDLLAENSQLIEPPAIVEGERIYRRLRDHLEDFTPEHIPSVRSLASDLGIETHKLRQVCREYAGLPLERMLIYLRLNGARRDLISAREQGKSVSEVAMDWGFMHWGRFAGRYKLLFGETPSTTLRQGR
ncbi:helix-turn-helix domain-containing protein [Stappia sp. BW2]|uniref:helix-turn-helix domain-containing protein n=1 Tax=Stappia sp. BW2 TaxID=2592622 RepID=UPI0011DED942|nr:helix-turn-helix domain-containing protein [Stappia sp. BW2]TYC63058.1 helix-turn-helix domain-containing protein [Stappia sp. BW2]